MIFYKAYNTAIEPIEVEKETEKFIFLAGRNYGKKQAKDTEWCWYCKTREEAKQKLIESQKQIINNLIEKLEYHKNKLLKIEKL